MKVPIVLLFLFVSLSVHAQKDKAILFFRNGEKLEGLARMREDGTVKFRKDKENEACIYTHNEIFGLQISQTGSFLSYDEVGTNTYYYKIIRTGNSVEFPKLLKLEVEGKMSLYIVSHTATPMVSSGLNGFGGGMNMGVGPRSKVVRYYISRDTSDFVNYFISDSPGIGKSFKKAALKVFHDCPVIVEKIKKREYKREDIESMVREYNQKCAR